MLLDTKAAKIILWSLAGCLCLLAIFVVVAEGGDNSRSAADEEVAATALNTPTPLTSIESGTPLIPSETDEIPIADVNPINRVYILPAENQIAPGEEFTLTVKAQIDGAGISGSEIVLRFDPVLFQIMGIDAEGVMGGNPLTGMEEIDAENGLIKYAVARKGETEAIKNAPETIAAINFAAIDLAPEGISRFTLSEVKLTDNEFSPVTEFEVQNAAVTILE